MYMQAPTDGVDTLLYLHVYVYVGKQLKLLKLAAPMGLLHVTRIELLLICKFYMYHVYGCTDGVHVHVHVRRIY